MNFTGYRLRLRALFSHAFVVASICFGETVQFEFGMCDSERLFRTFGFFFGDLCIAVARVEHDLWNLDDRLPVFVPGEVGRWGP